MEIYEELKKGQELFNSAISGENVDKKLMEEAAKFRYPLACIFLGKECLIYWNNDINCKEIENLARRAAEYFDVARKMAVHIDLKVETECNFLWLVARLQYEYDIKARNEILASLRSIKKLKILSKENTDILQTVFKTIVDIRPTKKVSSNRNSHVISTMDTKIYFTEFEQRVQKIIDKQLGIDRTPLPDYILVPKIDVSDM